MPTWDRATQVNLWTARPWSARLAPAPTAASKSPSDGSRECQDQGNNSASAREIAGYTSPSPSSHPSPSTNGSLSRQGVQGRASRQASSCLTLCLSHRDTSSSDTTQACLKDLAALVALLGKPRLEQPRLTTESRTASWLVLPQPQCLPQCPQILGSRLSDFSHTDRHATMGTTTTNAYSPRGPRPDRPRSSQRSSRNLSPHPPSRSTGRYPFLRMAPPPPGHDTASAPNTPSSPSLRHAHPALRPRPSQRKGSTGSLGGEDRPPTPMSKGSAKDSQHSSQQGPQSTLLQEKLQRERRSEIQRNLNRMAGDMGPATESRVSIATPTRCATADGRRHDASQENGDSRKKGLALKEMEQVFCFLLFHGYHVSWLVPN